MYRKKSSEDYALSATHHPLDHFYVGQSPKLGDSKFEQTVLAASAGVTADMIERMTARYSIQRNGIAHSFSLIRDSVPGTFFIVHIQRGAGGQPLAHYIILPSDVLRGNQGNLRALQRILDVTPPVFPPTRQMLSAILFPQSSAVSTSDQTSDILNLMTTVHNKMDVMESLLSAIVQGVRLVIQNAPIDAAQRTNLIEGLLALLPPSVRFAVTFIGDVGFHHEVDSQVCFVREMVTATDVVRFDWENGQVFGLPLKDDYSRFTISQLRLDTSLVIERTRAMHLPAAWYLNQGHKLAEALTYASYRLKIDQALMANMPVNKEDISQILSTDPTLSDSLRAAYARYLLKMALAMQSADQADPVADMFEKLPDLEREAFDQMTQTAEKGAASVFKAIARWFARGVTLPNRTRWAQLAQRSALLAAQTLAKNRDLAGIAALSDDLNTASHALDLRPVSHPLLEALIPFATQGADLAERIFLLVATLLDIDTARQFLAAPSLRGMLPNELTLFMSALEQNAPPPAANNGLLVSAARALGTRWEGTLISQFGIWARRAGRITLVDDAAFNALARHALSEDKPQQAHIYSLIDQLSQEEIMALGPKGGMHLMRIRLALNDLEGLVAVMSQQARTFYLGEAQIRYIFVIERVFTDTPTSPEAARAAIKYLSENKIQHAPLIMAGLGTLTNRAPHPETDEVAEIIGRDIRAHPSVLDVIPPASMVKLAAYNLKSGRSKAAAESGGWVSACAAKQEKHSIDAFKLMVENIGRSGLVTPVGQDMLRSAARQIDAKELPQLQAYLAREFTAEFSAQFENTAYLNIILLGRDISGYLRAANAAWRLLAGISALYANNKTPTEDEIETMMGTMSGQVVGQERDDLRGAIAEMMKALVAAAEAKRTAKPKGDGPAATIDVIRAIGTALASDRTPPTLPSDQPLGVQDKQALKQAIMAVTAVAGRMIRPVPNGLNARTFKIEVESLLAAVPPEEVQGVRERAVILSQLGRFVYEIGSGNTNKVTEASAYAKKIDQGKQRPRNGLEFLRYLLGYFSRKG